MALLSVRNLRTYFHLHMGTVKAVDGISFDLEAGKTLGIVGESGSGKTVTCLSLLKLIPMPPAEIVGGQAYLEGRDLLSLSEKELRGIRGRKMAMIFQEPMTALNPLYTVGEQIAETIRHHQAVTRAEAFEMAVEMLAAVSIPLPRLRAKSYPHQLSGGMKQRVMIALAMSCRPKILIADEPSTALDVTIQAQILRLIHELKSRTGTSVILVTHNMGVITATADEVMVLYLGKMVEKGEVYALFNQPRHPYTQGLLDCILKPSGRRNLPKILPGFIPHPINRPSGCPFHPRCPKRKTLCAVEEPPVVRDGRQETVCWLYA